MTTTREELISWVTATPKGSRIGIDEGGIELVVVETGERYEMGGVPDEETCADCGDIMRFVAYYPVGRDNSGNEPFNKFECPSCGEIRELPCDTAGRSIDQLPQGGVA